MNLGTTIKCLRKSKGINQRSLSESCGITQGYLSQIENNKREPTITTLRQISTLLDVPLPVMLLLSIDESDIPEEKRSTYQTILPAVRSFIDGIFIQDQQIGPSSAT